MNNINVLKMKVFAKLNLGEKNEIFVKGINNDIGSFRIRFRDS